MRFWRKLWRKQEGAAILEFAIVAPVFLTALVGVIELAGMLFTWAMFESAVSEAARYGTTGSVLPGTSREQRVSEIVQDRTIGIIPMQDVHISSKIYPDFASIGTGEIFTDSNHNNRWDAGESFIDMNGNQQWDEDIGIDGMGDSGQIVLYRVSYVWQGYTPLWAAIIGQKTFTVTTAVMNEPWNAG